MNLKFGMNNYRIHRGKLPNPFPISVPSIPKDSCDSFTFRVGHGDAPIRGLDEAAPGRSWNGKKWGKQTAQLWLENKMT